MLCVRGIIYMLCARGIIYMLCVRGIIYMLCGVLILHVSLIFFYWNLEFFGLCGSLLFFILFYKLHSYLYLALSW